MYSRFAASVNSGGATGASLAVPGTVLRVAVTDWVFWAMSLKGTRACLWSQGGNAGEIGRFLSDPARMRLRSSFDGQPPDIARTGASPGGAPGARVRGRRAA